MPVIIYKEKIKDEELYFAFDCAYHENGGLYLKNMEPSYFDSGDFRLKIEEAVNNFSDEILEKYMKVNKGVYYLAILNYFVDEIPSIYSIKFVSETSESIYYPSDLNC